jgi:hypothetical protein
MFPLLILHFFLIVANNSAAETGVDICCIGADLSGILEAYSANAKGYSGTSDPYFLGAVVHLYSTDSSIEHFWKNARLPLGYFDETSLVDYKLPTFQIFSGFSVCRSPALSGTVVG